MNYLKKITVFVVLLVGIFAFSKSKNIAPISSLKLEEVNVIEMLSSQEFGCRPSSEVMFHVETVLVKKARGFNTINAKVYVIDRFSGQSNLLASENIIVPSYKDAVLHYESATSNCEKIVLKTGDKIVGNDSNSLYCFNELIKYEVIYNSYMKSTNKLLHLDRIL